jgi:hypothetical protein
MIIVTGGPNSSSLAASAASASPVSAPVTVVHTITPIQPMQSPLGPFFSMFSPNEIFGIVFALVFIVWALYTVVVLYHWFRYGRRSTITIPMIIVHFVVSGFLFLMASSAFISSFL